MTVERSSNSFIRDLVKEYKRCSIDIQKVPDVEFIGEEGIDANGLAREFCHLICCVFAMVRVKLKER